MPKIPKCDRCCYYAHDYHLVCVPHPDGPESDSCSDFTPNPDLEGKWVKDFLSLQWQQRENTGAEEPFSNPFDLGPDEELWQPEGAAYYAGELIVQPRQHLTPEEQLWLLDNHPLFTGKCPQCGYQFDRDYTARVHWDCPECSWMDDTV